MTVSKILAAAAVTGAMLVAAAPASAASVTFATYSPIGTSANLYWKNDGDKGVQGTGGSLYTISSASSKVAGSSLVKFSFLQASLVPYISNIDATFTLFATAPSGNPATLIGNIIVQPEITGSFSFLTTSAITVGTHTFAAGSNLLSATFDGANILGQRVGTSGSAGGSTSGGTPIVYTSDFLDFSSTIDQDFQLSLTSIFSALQAVPTSGTPTKALRTFRATSSGNFSSDPAPIVTAVPEPAVWGLMILGFGMVGMQTRRRAHNAKVVA